jgi:ABC-type Fe3+-hydroxamate transport system substrate-binding protein
MDWKGLGIVGCWALFAIALSLGFQSVVVKPPASVSTAKTIRVASLSPAITETLFALGAHQELVARTDHCLHPADAAEIPSVGPGLSPDLEGLAKRSPSLIIVDKRAKMDLPGLRAIAPAQGLPWLTLADVLESTETLGKLVEREAAAKVLTDRLRRGLEPAQSADSPRVLLLIGARPDSESLWFIKRNSLHGQALHAAGARNAIDRDVEGAPELSMEGLLKVNPDIIIGLADVDELSDSQRAGFERRFNAFPGLVAAERRQVAVIARPGTMSAGPLILNLVTDLKSVLQRFRKGGQP